MLRLLRQPRSHTDLHDRCFRDVSGPRAERQNNQDDGQKQHDIGTVDDDGC